MKTRAEPRFNAAPSGKHTGARSTKNPARLAAKAPGDQRAKRPKNVPLLLEHFPGPDMERIYFEFYRPDAAEVFVAGTFNDWNPASIPLHNQGNGRWAVALELFRGRHEYRLIVDGSWTDDPLACAYVSNAFGGLNAVLVV